MKYPIYIVLIFLLSFTLPSCEDEVVVEDLSCSLQTIQHDIDSDTIVVTYKIEGEGNYKVSSWTYQGVEGEVTLQDPVIPSEVTLNFFGNALPRAKAVVTVVEGAVKVSFSAEAADSTYVGIDQCQQQIN